MVQAGERDLEGFFLFLFFKDKKKWLLFGQKLLATLAFWADSWNHDLSRAAKDSLRREAAHVSLDPHAVYIPSVHCPPKKKENGMQKWKF